MVMADIWMEHYDRHQHIITPKLYVALYTQGA